MEKRGLRSNLNWEITATIFRGAADGRGSNALNVRTPISVQTGDGVVQLFVLRSTRGSQGENSMLTVEAICAKQVDFKGPGQVFFRGHKIDCQFTKGHESDGLWLVTFVATIAIPEYWGDS